MTDPLAHEPFSWRQLKNESVQIFFNNKLATTLSARDGAKFVARVSGQPAPFQQQLMARATGQFKFGNEKAGKVNSTS